MFVKYINIVQSKALQNWYFWLENKPSGNPAFELKLLICIWPQQGDQIGQIFAYWAICSLPWAGFLENCRYPFLCNIFPR
jgi:hypothetical protein